MNRVLRRTLAQVAFVLLALPISSVSSVEWSPLADDGTQQPVKARLHPRQSLLVQTGTLTLRFDEAALADLGWRMAPTAETEEATTALFEVLSPSTLSVAATEGDRIADLSGTVETQGAFLLANARARVAVGNLALSVTPDGTWGMTDNPARDPAERIIFSLDDVKVLSLSADRLQVTGNFSLDQVTANRLGVARAAGMSLGVLALSVELVSASWSSHAPIIDGDTYQADTAETVSSVGADVIVGDIQHTPAGIAAKRWAREGDITAYSIGTTACNVGDVPLSWREISNHHPVIAQNMYRFKNGALEQIGLSWVKHGFMATGRIPLCSPVCMPDFTGNNLGVGCLDAYSATLNGIQENLGPRSDVHAPTGIFPYPYSTPPLVGGIARRLQVHDADLEPSLNSGARYFLEAHYITADDAAAGNQDNNASYREVNVLRHQPHVYDLVIGKSETQRKKPAILAWQEVDAAVTVTNVDVSDDRRIILGQKVTSLANGRWRYEFAVQNLNSDRAVGSFSVPVTAGVHLTNIGFHDVDEHSGSIFDSADWVAEFADGRLAWRTDTFANNPNANALRWGSLYNFRFDADTCPVPGAVTLGLFKPGSPPTMSVAAQVPDVGWVIVSSDPPHGAIDARQPSDLTGSNVAGWQSLIVTFAAESSCRTLAPADFNVTQIGGTGTAPIVNEVNSLGNGAYEIVLSRRISERAWTIVTHPASGTTIRLGFLPGDVNGDRLSNTRDIISIVDALNGVGGPRPVWSADINRIKGLEIRDVLREVELLNGSGVYDHYLGARLPPIP